MDLITNTMNPAMVVDPHLSAPAVRVVRPWSPRGLLAPVFTVAGDESALTVVPGMTRNRPPRGTPL